jgi:hypothetical protein
MRVIKSFMKNVVTESFKYEYGCVMGMFDEVSSDKIFRINKHLIPDHILYHEEGEEYGRESEPHVTIKFGLTTTYSKEDMRAVISKIHPFEITLTKIDVFNNEKFDVIKFNVEGSYLRKLNAFFTKLPNEDQYPTYNPHITLAYVKVGTGNQFKKSIKPIQLLINRIKYSNSTAKYFYDLK